MGLPTPDEAGEDLQAARCQPLPDREAVLQASFPLREGGYGLLSTTDAVQAAYLGGKALLLARAVTALSETQATRG